MIGLLPHKRETKLVRSRTLLWIRAFLNRIIFLSGFVVDENEGWKFENFGTSYLYCYLMHWDELLISELNKSWKFQKARKMFCFLEFTIGKNVTLSPKIDITVRKGFSSRANFMYYMFFYKVRRDFFKICCTDNFFKLLHVKRRIYGIL